jgi:F-type H+-transporting ATPase subunit a
VLFGALEFPPISHILEWPDMFLKGNEYFAINKIVLGYFIAVLLTFGLFFLAGRQQGLVPSGVRNVAESAVDFIRNGIVLQTMGPDGLPWTPFLLSIFSFIIVNNILGIIPGWQMPGTGRMAVPAFLALLTYVLFNVIGIMHQGLGGYFKNSLFPPGVPKALYILVTPIEFISTFLVRPFSLAVRLFANLLAGHILLITFGVLAAALWVKGPLVVIMPLPFLMLIFLTGLELLVAFLQAYIFTILAAVYIGGAMHPEH